ncbi:hypothetical protein HRbin11_01044 [bacterium HR11]|nr:hypothetical protein HRbin11_01044 [bacterium HR11]
MAPRMDAGPLVNLTLRYGEGLFETLLVRPGRRPVLWPYHRERMTAAARHLGYPLGPDRLDRYLQRCLRRMDPDRPYRLRIQAVVYGDPQPRRVRLVAEAQPLPTEPPTWQALRLQVQTFPGWVRWPWKTCDYLWFHWAWRRAVEAGFDDALLVNRAGRPFSLGRANLWVARGTTLWTPPLSEGALAGTLRRFLLTHLPALGWQVRVRPLEWDDLERADFVMATNSVRLLMPVGSVAGVGTWDDRGRLRTLWDRLGPRLF